jgi:hypothetical protein
VRRSPELRSKRICEERCTPEFYAYSIPFSDRLQKRPVSASGRSKRIVGDSEKARSGFPRKIPVAAT